MWQEAVQHLRAAAEMPGAPPGHALEGLGPVYRAAVMHLQQSSGDPPRTQQEAVERVQALMGAENYGRLAASRRR
jgi:alkyl hydroperoxide reductase subunit AhpF